MFVAAPAAIVEESRGLTVIANMLNGSGLGADVKAGRNLGRSIFVGCIDGIVCTWALESQCAQFIGALRQILQGLIVVEGLLVEFGSTATTYEPYTNTVYGGTLDVEKGELTVDRGIVDLGTLDWTYQSNYARFRATLPGRWGTDNDSYVPNNELKCEIYPPCSTAYTRQLSDFVNGIATGTTTNNYIYSKDNRYSDANDYKTAMNGVHLIYELATPRTISLTPEQVQLLKGQNTIWTDGDNIKLIYKP